MGESIKPIEDDVLGGAEAVLTKEKSLTNRSIEGLKRFVNLTRLSEYMWTNMFFGMETYYDMRKVPENYAWLIDPEKVAPLAIDPKLKGAIDSMGDMLEISVGHGIVRVGLAAVNEVLRSKPAKEATKRVFGNKKIQQFSRIFLDDQKISQYEGTGEVEISDDASFWIALVPWWIVKAAHSLGYISLWGIHDHMDDPVPQMLIGQLFAASTLIATHYAVKHPELVTNIVRSMKSHVRDETGSFQKTILIITGKVEKLMRAKGEQLDEMFSDCGDVLTTLNERMDASFQKMNEFDPSSWVDGLMVKAVNGSGGKEESTTPD